MYIGSIPIISPDPKGAALLTKRGKMSEKSKNHVIYADEETHAELSTMAALASVAARKKVTIKETLKALVEEKKAQSTPSPKPEFPND